MSTLPDPTSDALFGRVAAILEQARVCAGHGDALLAGLAGLAARLTGHFGKGYSETNLKYFRQFYVVYADRTPEIRHEPRDQLAPLLASPRGRVRRRAPRRHRPRRTPALTDEEGWPVRARR